MSSKSDRALPPSHTPMINEDGTPSLDWYNYFRIHDQEHGGDLIDRLVRCAPVGSPVTSGAGNPILYVGGVAYELVKV